MRTFLDPQFTSTLLLDRPSIVILRIFFLFLLNTKQLNHRECPLSPSPFCRTQRFQRSETSVRSQLQGQNRAKHHCHPQKNLLQTNYRPGNTQYHRKQKASKNSHDLYDEKHRIARRREPSTEVEKACAELAMIVRTREGGGGGEGRGEGEEEKRANQSACCC